MDDLRSTLRGFDADAPLPPAPDPWDAMPTPGDPARPAVGDGRDDRGRARPRGPGRRPPGRGRVGGRAGRCGAPGRDGAAARDRHRLRHVRARGAGRGRDPPRRVAVGRAARSRPGVGAGLRAVARSARGRARHRRQPRGRDGGDDRGAGRRAGGRGATALLTVSAASPAADGADPCWRRSRWIAAGATRSATSRRSWRRGRRRRSWPAVTAGRAGSGAGCSPGSRRPTDRRRRLSPGRGDRGDARRRRRTCS